MEEILVAPYWNLNLFRFHQFSFSSPILVAPYWNLNYGGKAPPFFGLSILVAPYWNLNVASTTGDYDVVEDISSSILEFKCVFIYG